MKLDDSHYATIHYKRVVQLAERLSRARVAIYEHRYTYMAFGSWEIVAGRRTRMLRFSYDGKDSYLSYGDASMGPRGHEDLKHRRFATHEGEDPLAYIADVLEAEFARSK